MKYVVSPQPRPARPVFPSTALSASRQWLREIVALNRRSPAEREEFKNPPGWLRAAWLTAFLFNLYALSRLRIDDILPVAALTIFYSLTMLVPPVASPLGYIRTPRVAFIVTLCLLWSPLHTLIAVAYGTLLAVVAFQLYEPQRAMSNTIYWAYPASIASAAGHTVIRLVPGHLIGLTAASITILVVYLMLNFAALALYRKLRFGDNFFSYWWSCLRENPLAQILAAPLPILLGAIALGLNGGPLMALLLTAFSAITMPAGREQLAIFLASQRTVQDIVQALMIALERVVPGAQAHSKRVGALVAEMGRSLRMSARTIESWRTAALLHDIGLIDASSRGASVVSHAIVGARILDSYPDPMVADMVREHHTPSSAVPPRLRNAVSLGARVLAAAEYYDELRYGTSTTPGLITHAATAAALQPLIGRQLNPRIAALLLDAAERVELKTAS
jgi:putative nucleotidyltransferase with HDIG domain